MPHTGAGQTERVILPYELWSHGLRRGCSLRGRSSVALLGRTEECLDDDLASVPASALCRPVLRAPVMSGCKTCLFEEEIVEISCDSAQWLADGRDPSDLVKQGEREGA